jgi:D-alanine-D-alanine ligase
MKKIAILYGGRSGEHEVSLISASSILEHIDRKEYEPILIGIDTYGRWYLQDEAVAAQGRQAENGMAGLAPIVEGKRVFVAPGAGLEVESGKHSVKKLPCDVVFPILHGTFGEDGTVQGLIECAGLPYVGAGVLGSAVGMDKQIAKELWLREGLPVVDYITIRSSDRLLANFDLSLIRKIEARFGWPCFVKPACSGSSVGISKVHGKEELDAALTKAFKYDQKIMVEEYIPSREIECAVLGNENPLILEAGEIIPSHEFYDYEAKYLDPEGAAFKIPAELTELQRETLNAFALKAYKACELSGMARVDFFIDRRTGKLLLNEVNTIPGFTAISMYPKMCQASGISYSQLLSRLIDLALSRFAARSSLTYSFHP